MRLVLLTRLAVWRHSRHVSSREWSERFAAVEHLARLASPAAVTPMLAAMAASSTWGGGGWQQQEQARLNKRLHEVARNSLRSITDPTAITPLVEGLAHKDSSARQEAGWALDAQHSGWRTSAHARSAVPFLAARLTDDDSSVRGAAVRALTEIDGAWAAAAAIRGTIARVAAFRRRIATNIGHDDLESALSKLDPLWMTRPTVGTAGTLAARSARTLAARLKEGGSDKRGVVREITERALGAAIPQLVEIVVGDNLSLRSDAAEALAGLGSLAVPRVAELLLDEKTAKPAANLLGRIRDPVAVPALLEAFGRHGKEAKDAIAHALLCIGTPDALPVLIAAWESGSHRSPALAAALARLGWTPTDSLALQAFEVQFGEYRGPLAEGRAPAWLVELHTRSKTRAEAALSARQASCVHGPGRWSNGETYCVHCHVLLERCEHNWKTVSQYKEEGSFVCTICGMGSV